MARFNFLSHSQQAGDTAQLIEHTMESIALEKKQIIFYLQLLKKVYYKNNVLFYIFPCHGNIKTYLGSPQTSSVKSIALHFS